MAKRDIKFQGVIVVSDEDEGPCILHPLFVPEEKDDFDAQTKAGVVEDGRRVFSYLWLEKPVSRNEAYGIAGKMRPFGQLGAVVG